MDKDDAYCRNCGEEDNLNYQCSRANFDWYVCGNCGDDVRINNDNKEQQC